MKRLFRVSLDSLIFTMTSILIWFVLSAFFDRELITVFILVFPIQYMASILRAVFATGANISQEKGNRDDVLSAMTIGIAVSIVVFGIIIFYIDYYLSFMNTNIAKNFVIYAVLVIFLETILRFVVVKLYYESKNVLANKYTAIFYIMNFVCILTTSLLFNNVYYIIIPTLACLSIYIVYLTTKSYRNFKFSFNTIKWIKYNLVKVTDNIFLGLAYLVGLNIALYFGESYALAITFVALITDVQWNISDSIETVAKIDIAKNQFNYKEHMRNAYKLIMFLIISIIALFIALFSFYDLNLTFTLLFLSFHIADFMIAPIYKIDTFYLQLEYSTFKTTTNNVFGRVIRVLLSFFRTPFNTVIAQLIPQIYLAITMHYTFRKNYTIDPSGKVICRIKNTEMGAINCEK